MRQAEERLFFPKVAQIFLGSVLLEQGVEKSHLGPLDSVADKTTLFLGRKLAPLYFAGTSAAHRIFLQLLEVALKDQGQAQPVFLGAHLGKVMGTKTQPVGFNPHVRLHHSRPHNVFYTALFQHAYHGTDGTAVFFL